MDRCLPADPAADRRLEALRPLLRTGLLAGASLFLLFGAWEWLLAGPAALARTWPLRLSLALVVAALGIASGRATTPRTLTRILLGAVVVTSAGITRLASLVPEGSTFAIGGYLLQCLVLALVAPGVRLTLVAAGTQLASVSVVVVTSGEPLTTLAPVLFFVAPAHAVTAALVHLRAVADDKFREAHAALERLSRTDALTGLPNRRAFEESAARLVAHARRHDRPLAALVLDVDHFKRVNDTHGHAAGDAVLREVGRVIGVTLRDADLPGRLGGEEFAVLLPDTAPDGAHALAERLRDALARAVVTHEGTPIRLTASLGVASLAPDQSLATLLARADDALYAAKHAGRNRTVVATPVAPAAVSNLLAPATVALPRPSA